MTKSTYEAGDAIYRMVAETGSTDNAGFPSAGTWDQLGVWTPSESDLKTTEVKEIGDHDVDFVSKDWHENKSACKFQYRVIDKAAPEIKDAAGEYPSVCGSEVPMVKDLVSQDLTDLDGERCFAVVGLARQKGDPFWDVMAEDQQERTDGQATSYHKINTGVKSVVSWSMLGKGDLYFDHPSLYAKDQTCNTSIGSTLEVINRGFSSETRAVAAYKCSSLCSERTDATFLFSILGEDNKCGCATECDELPLVPEDGTDVWNAHEKIPLACYEDADCSGNEIEYSGTGETISLTPGRYEFTFEVIDQSANNNSCAVNLSIVPPTKEDRLVGVHPAKFDINLVDEDTTSNLYASAMTSGLPLPFIQSPGDVTKTAHGGYVEPSKGHTYKFSQCQAKRVDFQAAYESSCSPCVPAWLDFGTTSEFRVLGLDKDSTEELNWVTENLATVAAEVRADMKDDQSNMSNSMARAFSLAPATCNPWVATVEVQKQCTKNSSTGMLQTSNGGMDTADDCLAWCTNQFSSRYDDYIKFDGSLGKGHQVENMPLWCSHSEATKDCYISTNCWKEDVADDDNFAKEFTNFVGAYLQDQHDTYETGAKSNNRLVSGLFTPAYYSTSVNGVLESQPVTFRPKCWYDSPAIGHMEMEKYEFQIVEDPHLPAAFKFCQKSITLGTDGNWTFGQILRGEHNISSATNEPVESFMPTFSDDENTVCPSALVRIDDHDDDTVVTEGQYEIVWVLEDHLGRVSDQECETTITVVAPPIIDAIGFDACPADIYSNVPRHYPFVGIQWNVPSIIFLKDNSTVDVDNFTLTGPNFQSGTSFYPGIYMVKYSASDHSFKVNGSDEVNVTINCEFSITVGDVVDPDWGDSSVNYECGPNEIGVKGYEICGGITTETSFDEADRAAEIKSVISADKADCCGAFVCEPLLNNAAGIANGVKVCQPVGSADNGGGFQTNDKTDARLKNGGGKTVIG